MRTRQTHLFADDIQLPPAFNLIALREVGDAFGYATEHASEIGAGSLVHVGRFDLSEFAVVLEPEEPLRLARRSFYACMAALADAIAVCAPPETPMQITWPDTVTINLGLVGGGRLAWPKGAREDEPPEWLVFGAMIRLVSMAEGDAGLRPLSAALEEEGFDGADSSRLIEAFARHLMSLVDAWHEEGFAAVSRSYLPRLAVDAEKGLRRDIDENGDLLLRRMGKTEVERRKLLSALEAPAWFDPATRGPR